MEIQKWKESAQGRVSEIEATMIRSLRTFSELTAQPSLRPCRVWPKDQCKAPPLTEVCSKESNRTESYEHIKSIL
eukprot:701696-Amphidinium_carterae.1